MVANGVVKAAAPRQAVPTRRRRAVGRDAAAPPPPGSVVDFVLRRQLELSGSILLAILVANALSGDRGGSHLSTDLTPDPSFHFRSIPARFLFLSFRQPGTELYYKGRDDAFLIAWWVIAFCFLREATMRWVFRPLARWSGIRSSRAVVRFAEQGWSLVYYTLSWSIGLYINQTSPYKNLNTYHFWKGYPHIALPALTKWYYLVQTACTFPVPPSALIPRPKKLTFSPVRPIGPTLRPAVYLQQILVINLEARRKDYYQMFAHHIITSMLMMSSYVLNWTRIGNAILCTMDLVDITLPLAKLFKYTGWHQASDITFAIFFLLWILTRHVIFGRIIYSIVYESNRILEFRWSSAEGYFWSKRTYYGFVGLLGCLQLIICLWFAMILRVLWNMFRGHSAEDTRSDEEDENDLDDLDVDVGTASFSDDEEEGEGEGEGLRRVATRSEGENGEAARGNGHGDARRRKPATAGEEVREDGSPEEERIERTHTNGHATANANGHAEPKKMR
ncbi:hypothetical protein JCM10908_004465 [Rhodotorula pacifica]|uniref:uncharacterized protein n=1 Tax=Rhodotorula pacifica TaxID=1495444 RepID=UPI0031760821